MTDLTLSTDEGKLNIRTAAVILNDGKILVETTRYDFCVLPGGRVKFGETAERAIVRELKEELGENVTIVRPLYVHQNVFELEYEDYHEICFYFLVNVSKSVCEKQNFRNLSSKSVFVWKSIEELKKLTFFPRFLQKEIDDLPTHTVLKSYES